jgi:peptide/nickel transport system permease protein
VTDTAMSDGSSLAWLRLRTKAFRVMTTLLRWLSVLVPVFLVATFFTFLLSVISGIDPVFVVLGDNPSASAVADLTAKWGLDSPFLVQYWHWLAGIFTGDFGESWVSQAPLGNVLLRRALISLWIAVTALVIGIGVGTALGVLAVRFHGSWLDRAITFFTTIMSVLPAFIMGIALILVFAVALPLLPSAGYSSPSVGFWPWFSHILLPATALSLDLIADIARQLRTAILGTHDENYLLGAKLNGYSGTRQLWAYSIRNGVGPAITLIGLKLPSLVGGAVITETIFGIPGLGMYAAQSALAGDVPAVQGVLVICIIAVVAFNFIVNSLLNVLAPAGQRGS